MSSIHLTSGDRSWSADTARVFTIGRDESCDIVPSDPTISRRHAEVRALGEGWEVVDLGSSLGTWVNGQRVDRADLVGTTTIGFGNEGRGYTLTVTVTPASPSTQPLAAPPAPAAPPPFSPAPPAAAPTPARPVAPTPAGGVPPQAPVLGQTMVVGGGGPPGTFGGGPGLLVRRRLDGDLRFPGGTLVRIGRDPSLEVEADDPAVSRLHAVVEPRPDGWWYVDRSTTGSFVDGERVTQRKIEEPVEISLGHPTAGYGIEVVPVLAAGAAVAQVQRRRRNKTLVRAGAAAGALVLVGGGLGAAFLLGGNDDEKPTSSATDTTPTTPDRSVVLDRAKAATVLIQAFDASGQGLYSGSGSIISDTGLVLTNAHVGDPDAPGQGASDLNPDYLTISLTSGDDDKPAEAAYRAEPIVSDGYLDMAVLQIVADIDGNPVDKDSLDLPTPLPIGDSDKVRTGDQIIALGYPAIGNVSAQGDRPLTITEGVVSTFQADPIIGTDRGSIDSDVRLGSGNSGGPSINQAGEIIGLNTRVITADSMDAGAITQGSALIVPVNLAEAILDIARDGGDPSYVSPYVDQMPSDPTPSEVSVVSAGWVQAGEEGSCGGTSTLDAPQQLSGVAPGDTLYAEYNVEGVPDGVPFSIDFYLDETTRLDTLSGTWDFGSDAICIYAPYTVSDPIPQVIALVSLGQDGEVSVPNPLLLP